MKNFITRLIKNNKGNVTIEAALAFILIAALLIGGADFGRLAMKQSQLEHVARAGTHYGLRGQTDAQDLVAVVAAARASIGADGDALTITAENVCLCPGQTGTIGCNDTCLDDSYPQMLLTVVVEADASYLFGYSGTIVNQLEASNTLRVR